MANSEELLARSFKSARSSWGVVVGTLALPSQTVIG
jgi:hypothetical protein